MTEAKRSGRHRGPLSDCVTPLPVVIGNVVKWPRQPPNVPEAHDVPFPFCEFSSDAAAERRSFTILSSPVMLIRKNVIPF